VSSVWPSRPSRGRRATNPGTGFFDNISIPCRRRLRGLKRFEFHKKKFEETLQQRWQEDTADTRAIDVKVAMFSGQQWALRITARTTGADVRARIAQLVGAPRSEVALVFGTVSIEDNEVMLESHPSLRSAADPMLTMFRVQRHFALSASSDKKLRMWDLDSKSYFGTMTGHMLRVNCISVDWASRRALSGSSDGTLRLWNLDTQMCVETFGDDMSDIKCMCVNWDLQKVLAGDIAAVRLWDLGTATCLGTLRGDVYVVQCLAVDWVRQRALSGSCDGAVGFWDLESFAGVTTLYGHMTWVTCVSLDTESSHGLSAAIDGTIRLWNADAGICLNTIQGQEWGDTRCIEVCWSTMCAVSGAAGGLLKLWDLSAGYCFKTLHSGLEVGMLHDVSAIAADWSTNQVVTGSVNGEIRIWDLENPDTPVEVLKGHTHEVGCLSLCRYNPAYSSASLLRTLANEYRAHRELQFAREESEDGEEDEESEEEEEELEPDDELVESDLSLTDAVGACASSSSTAANQESLQSVHRRDEASLRLGAERSDGGEMLIDDAHPSTRISSSRWQSGAEAKADPRERPVTGAEPGPIETRAVGGCFQGPRLCFRGLIACWRGPCRLTRSFPARVVVQ